MPLIYWMFSCSALLGVFYTLMAVPLLWLRVPYFKQLALVRNRHSNVWHMRQQRRTWMAQASHTNLVLSVLSGCVMLGFFDSNNYPPSCVTELYAEENINAAQSRLQFVLCGLSSGSLDSNAGAHYFVLAKCRFYLLAQFIMLVLVNLALFVAYIVHSERARIVLHRSVHSMLKNQSAAAAYLESGELQQQQKLEKMPLKQLMVTFVDDDFEDGTEVVDSVETENECDASYEANTYRRETTRTDYRPAEMQIDNSDDDSSAGAPISPSRRRPPREYYRQQEYGVLPSIESLKAMNGE